MALTPNRFAYRAATVLAVLMLLRTGLPSQQQTGYVFHAESDLVLVNVTVRDKSGKFVPGLKPEDFTILEDSKPQKIVSFDVENVDAVPASDVAQAKPLPEAASGQTSPAPSTDLSAQFKDRRLIVLFFDLSAMEPDEIDRAVTSAERYVDTQMAPADLVSIVSLGSSLLVNQDFTADQTLLKKQLDAFNSGTGQGFEEGSTGTTEGTPDSGQPFTADDTEYNIFNTDRRLEALRSVAEKLAHVQQKKSLIYFSSGMDRTGIENQSELRAAVNAAVRSNLAIYTMDMRGLQALVAGGEAQNASLRGVSAYSGQATLNALNSNFTTQETLVTLASDTGGRAFLDSNDFSKIFKGVQQDTSTYYLLGYHSTNPARDGRYRHIVVKSNAKSNLRDVKIDYRRGYYAPADYKHSTQDDKERQLEEELASELPATDFPLYLGVAYFRLDGNKFFVPISLVVPGSQIPFVRSSDRDKATLDVIGMVLDSEHHPLNRIRDTVKLAVSTSAEVQKKNVQYDTGMSLLSGKYHLKFVVRENQTGRMASFETDIEVPELKAWPLKMSSVVLANQIETTKVKTSANLNPLVRDGSEIIPNITHVFSATQHLFLYYEVYDPARPAVADSARGQGSKPGIRLLSNVAFFQGKVKAYESSLVELTELNARERKAAVFQLDVPLTSLKPGFYTCQVTVIDDVGGHFLFPRLALLVRQESSGATR